MRRARAAGFGLLLAITANCGGGTSDGGEAESDTKKEEKKEEAQVLGPLAAVQALVKHLNKGNADRARKLIADGATWRRAGEAEAATGADAILAARAREDALRLRLKANDLYVIGDVVVVGGALVGKHVADFGGVAPTKNGVGTEGAVLFRTKDGKITEAIEYIDHGLLYAQIGALPADKVWAQRDKPNAVVRKKPEIHEGAGDDALFAHLDKLHAGFIGGEEVTVPDNVNEQLDYWETAAASAIGGANIVPHFEELRTAIPDLKVTVEEKWAVDGAIIARTRWQGTHSAKYQAWPAKNAKLDIECLEEVQLEDGQVRFWTVHFNGHEVLRAMGAVEGYPG